MKSKTIVLAALLLPAVVCAAESVTYPVAHVRQGNVSTVLVDVGPNFFNSDGQSQARWYKAVQACVRSARLAGDVVAVGEFNRRFNYYGPKDKSAALEKLNMKWVRARVNKQLTCKY